MARLLFTEAFARDLDRARGEVVYIGDSPNDSPMFAYFPRSVGVANVRRFAGRMNAAPAYVTQFEAGAGFAELAAHLLAS
jgi:hydroxymethylpyrimidine pyrophosphatase-like HAD family hydrolase